MELKPPTFANGTKVSVNLHNLPGYEYFQWCSMDGIVLAGRQNIYHVFLLYLGWDVKVYEDRLQEKRGPDLYIDWIPGQHVQVLESNDGVDGWWDAHIVCRTGKNQWKVRWFGLYKGRPDTDKVSGNRLRKTKK